MRFQKSIRVTIEHGHANNFENDYTSTAFWYQKDPHKAFPPRPSAQERLPGWPQGVAPALENEARVEHELATLTEDGKIRLSDADAKLGQALTAARRKDFRELRYQDFRRDVLAMESLVNRCRRPNP